MAVLKLIEKMIIPTYDNEKYVKLGLMEIDRDKCDSCGQCVLICPGKVLCIEGSGKDKKATMIKANPQCMSCNDCQAICKRGAIRVKQTYDYGYRFKTIDRGKSFKPRLFGTGK
jgi:ferredoxin